MRIKNISFDQISVVAGGYNQPENITDEMINDGLGNCFTSIHVDVKSRLKAVSCGDNCFTRCMPNKKPKECDYAFWGKLHDLTEGEGIVIDKC